MIIQLPIKIKHNTNLGQTNLDRAGAIPATLGVFSSTLVTRILVLSRKSKFQTRNKGL